MINAVVCPTYLNRENLPYAADIFYHGKITYFLPTGFHPLELQSVFEFPSYCRARSIAFPSIIWEMCKLYFENSIEAKDCIDILEPIKREHIVIAAPVYNRDIREIQETKQFMHKYPQLLEIFKSTEINLKFASRELMGHVLYENILEKGSAGSVEYLRRNCRRVNDLVLLIAAVIVNRIRHFIPFIENILLYEHAWYALIMEIDKCQEIDKGEYHPSKYENSVDIEVFRFRLFEQILNPIFGKCDTKSKNEKIARLADSKMEEINRLKNKCEMIAREVVLMPTKEIQLKQKRLNELIESEISVPLSDLMDQPIKRVKDSLLNFMVDSTVIGGILTLAQGANVTTFTTAAAAGAISTAIKHIIRNCERRTTPSDLLVSGMKQMKIEYEDVQRYLSEIVIEQLDTKMVNPRNQNIL
ncbi:hypothetical protein [Dehalococcoides mccartyi]|uniref:Uncharacterized protein n=1 Tax=Dehalococcoides mccartyi TaxID=61435 RepID=A0A142V9R1_9CHLR|nr:hypothetical protein [Dehalococcoides mccartyi]AMU86005.1 hypothetical protein Dm11a5_0174 [Dehalococcoides mccartyi]